MFEFQDREVLTPDWGSRHHPKRSIGTPSDITRQSSSFTVRFLEGRRQSKGWIYSFQPGKPEADVTRQSVEGVAGCFSQLCSTPERLLATQVERLDKKKMKTHGLAGRDEMSAEKSSATESERKKRNKGKR